MRRHYYLLIAVAIVVGVLFRIYPLIGHQFYPGFDSPWYVYSTRLYESLGHVPATEVHIQGGGRPYVSDPAYVVFLTQFRLMLGLEEWDAMRVLSPILPILIGFGLFLWTRMVFSRSASRNFIALLVLAIFFIGFTDIRSLYPRLKQEMGMALMVMAVPFLGSYLSTGRRSHLWIGGLFAVGLAFTHLLVWGLFLLGILLGLLLIHLARRGREWRRSMLLLAFSGAITALIVLPRTQYTQDFVFGGGAEFNLLPLSRLALLPEYYMPALWILAAAGGAFAALTILKRKNPKDFDAVQAKLLASFVFVAFTLTISQLLPITILPHRFIIILNVLLTIPAGFGLYAISSSLTKVRVPWDAIRKAVVVSAVVALAFASYSYAMIEPPRFRVTASSGIMDGLDMYSTSVEEGGSSLTTARLTFWVLAAASHNVIWADNRMEFPDYARRATLANLIFYYACSEDIPALVNELRLEFDPILIVIPSRDRVHSSNSTEAPLISFDRFVDVGSFMQIYDNGLMRVIDPGETDNAEFSPEPGCQAALLSLNL